MSGIVSRLSALSKAGLCLAAGALTLVLLNFVLPGSSLLFPLVSLWCSLALFVLALGVLQVSGVKLGLFHRAVLAVKPSVIPVFSVIAWNTEAA